MCALCLQATVEAALEALGVDRATIDQLEGNSIKVSSTNQASQGLHSEAYWWLLIANIHPGTWLEPT